MKKFSISLLLVVLTLLGCKNINEEIEKSEIYKYLGIYPKMTYYYLTEKGLMTSIRVKDANKQDEDIILSSEMKIGIFSNKVFAGSTQEFKIIITPNEVKYLFEDEENYIFQTVIKSPITNNNVWFDNYSLDDETHKIENRIVSTNAVFKIYSTYLKNSTNQPQKELIEISNCVVVERKTKYQIIRNYFNKEIGFLGSEYLPRGIKGKPTVYRLYRISIKQ